MRTGMEWDEWYLEVCQTVAKKSQCLSRKIGAILVDGNRIVSTGHNGPPSGVRPCDERWLCDDKLVEAAGFKHEDLQDVYSEQYKKDLEGKCPRYVPELGFKSGEGLEWCVAAHAEENAIINAARNGIKTKGLKMYMNCQIPCKNCLIKIINVGIKEIIVTGLMCYDISSEYLLSESGLHVRIYNHITKSSDIY